MKPQICALFALAMCVCARTTVRQQSITPHITSLTDKDARQKAMVHPAFANAGRQAGVEVWRIENFDPVPVAQSDYGKFYKGDSYIILKTTSDNKNRLSYDIHYWIGNDSSQDESGAAAILTVGLDDKFNGAAVQYRETQGNESDKFKGYFRNALRYLDGGNASGFNHVTTNAGAEKRLLQVKGKRNVRVREVNPLISSMNKGDIFVLDVGNSVYVYVGSSARNVERLKAISVANQIRDQDHNGRASVEIIDQYSSEVDVQKFFTALGSGSPNTVPEDSAGGDDQAFEKKEEQSVLLSEVSDSTGKVKITPLAKPLKQEQLKPQEAYILDTVTGSIYVWNGKQATEKEKSEALAKAQEYRSSKNYPAWVKVVKIPQGTEPAIFKQYFQTWKDVGMKHSRIVRATDLLGIRTLALSGEPLDQKELKSDEIIGVPAGKIVYMWFGRDISRNMWPAIYELQEEIIGINRSGRPVSYRIVEEGREPEAFKALFKKWDPNMWKNKPSNGNQDEVLFGGNADGEFHNAVYK